MGYLTVSVSQPFRIAQQDLHFIHGKTEAKGLCLARELCVTLKILLLYTTLYCLSGFMIVENTETLSQLDSVSSTHSMKLAFNKAYTFTQSLG